MVGTVVRIIKVVWSSIDRLTDPEIRKVKVVGKGINKVRG